MQILIIAYEFPPICSAQSIRWHYLTAELVAMGHGVKVVTTDFRMDRDLAPKPDSRVEVFRSFPGFFVGASNRLERRLAVRRRERSPAPSSSSKESGLSRIYRLTRKALDQVVFPDVRSEWYFFAARVLRKLDRSGYRPDLVIGSHEPAVDLQLAIMAKRRFGAPVLADLGDPIDTVYSPGWRRWLDRRYEGYVLSHVDGATVTLENVRDRLRERHSRLPLGGIQVVPQAFDHRRVALSEPVLQFCPDRLNILFTGTLYEKFRNPSGFLKAVALRSDVTLWVAGNLVGNFPMVRGGGNIRVLGPLKHCEILEAQASAEVLLSVGNRQSEQIPGKIYEYIGARRPILHVYSNTLDPTCRLIREFRRGWVVAGDVESSAAVLDDLVESRRQGVLERELELSSSHAEKFSWRARAEQMVRFGSRLRD